MSIGFALFDAVTVIASLYIAPPRTLGAGLGNGLSLMRRETTVTSELLARLADDGLIDVGTWARLFGLGRSAAFRRMSGDTPTNLDEVAILCRNSPPQVALAVCEMLTEGLGIDHTWIDGSADIDGDGDVDTDDLLAGAAAIAEAFADELRLITESSVDGRVDHAEAESILERCSAVRHACLAVDRVVAAIRKPPRRRCRQTTGTRPQAHR